MSFKPENVDFTRQFCDPHQMDGEEVVENVRVDIGMSAGRPASLNPPMYRRKNVSKNQQSVFPQTSGAPPHSLGHELLRPLCNQL